ncbi:hypothetical protein MTR67_003275 [Solanum verrucosum]|uniref:Uncharacterized protein n=1 Tax=Solanum verrucosum TaxID=315347 RepID=A0AAF0PU15_SOLVR|nr:hypothetical protein MTR67_003275 [Solanum verrucosum]
MSHQQGDDVDYVVNGYEMEELDDFIDEFQGIDLGGFDSDVVIHWSSLTCAKTETVNLSEHVASLEKHPKNLSEGFMETQVNTFAVADKLLVACGLQGELIIKYLDKPRVSFCSRPTYDNDAIATAIEITNTISGAIL